MAVLETIRVKFGIVITALIAVALLSFIIDPQTLQQVWFSVSSKNDVGQIDSKSISYEEFQKDIDWNFCVVAVADDNRTQPISGAKVEIYKSSTDRDNGAVFLSKTTDAKGEALFTFAGSSSGPDQRLQCPGG